MEHVPHDVIVIDSSGDEAMSKAGRKRASAESSTSTSDAKKAKKRRKREVDDDDEAESHGRVTGEASLSKLAPSSPCPVPGIVMPSNPPSFSFESRTFLLPAFSDAMVGSWLQRFGRWVHALCLYNESDGETTTVRVAMKAYIHYLGCYSGLSAASRGKARKHANKATKELRGKETPAKDLGMRLAVATAMPAAAPVTPAAPVTSAAMASATVVVVADDASAAANGSRDRDVDAAAKTRKRVPRPELQQHRYYPSATDPANTCLYCSREGHVAADCPHKTCKFCGQTGHWHFACKTRQRCTDCRQLGHATSACGGAKKVEGQDQTGLTCAFCDDKDHLEDECTEVWRTYHPPDEIERVHKVKDMVISCAICASREHYFSECPDRKYPANPTWTLANRARYVDAECGVLSIAAAAEVRAGGYGHSVVVKAGRKQQTQIRYSASEDSDIEMPGGKKGSKTDGKAKDKKKKKYVLAATRRRRQREKTWGTG
ncbi:hypothetical protein CP532_5345 [Ophiocordyceps camponoti-leonardi (nom. inval.)]|nr:hypothetical protein CP532_5345 [Ophiocordyceps camponoti-leonardi (nom. inval.)]